MMKGGRYHEAFSVFDGFSLRRAFVRRVHICGVCRVRHYGSNICTPVSAADAKPGDLVFFIGTYDAPYPNRPTHVGIYVGGGRMIHCGDPISYANLNTPYWQSHLYGFGRLPAP